MSISKLDQLLLQHKNKVILKLNNYHQNKYYFTLTFTTFPSFERGLISLKSFGECGWIQGLNIHDRKLDIYCPDQIKLIDLKESIEEALNQSGFELAIPNVITEESNQTSHNLSKTLENSLTKYFSQNNLPNVQITNLDSLQESESEWKKFQEYFRKNFIDPNK